jgi:type IX secretion system PorP/SprF family membrane protein
MKKMVFALLGGIVCYYAAAQQKPQYTQYILNQYIVNPALTGIENYTDVKVSHRHQWAGLNGGPVTTYLTIQGPINKKDYRTTATSFDVPGENPRGNSYWEQYTAAQPHHGIGLQVVNDHTGPLNEFSAYATYAYHIGLSPKTSIAAGVGIGVSNLSIDASKLDFGDLQVDPSVYSSNAINTVKPDLNAGIYLYSSDYFIGLSAQQLIPQKIEFTDHTISTANKMVPHLFTTAGYRFLIGDDFNCIPSLMIKYVQPLPIQVEANVKLQYQDVAWVGLSVRQQDGFAAMLGINVSNTFNIGYAYDYSTSALRTVSKGTHELMIGFLIGNKYSDSCPKNIW